MTLDQDQRIADVIKRELLAFVSFGGSRLIVLNAFDAENIFSGLDIVGSD
jgi:hypothetical protein